MLIIYQISQKENTPEKIKGDPPAPKRLTFVKILLKSSNLNKLCNGSPTNGGTPELVRTPPQLGPARFLQGTIW